MGLHTSNFEAAPDPRGTRSQAREARRIADGGPRRGRCISNATAAVHGRRACSETALRAPETEATSGEGGPYARETEIERCRRTAASTRPRLRAPETELRARGYGSARLARSGNRTVPAEGGPHAY